MLTRYWITFAPSDELAGYALDLGAGVTAFDERDAIELLQKALGDAPLPVVRSIVPDVRFDDLERYRVQENAGNMAVRGIWYPPSNL